MTCEACKREPIVLLEFDIIVRGKLEKLRLCRGCARKEERLPAGAAGKP